MERADLHGPLTTELGTGEKKKELIQANHISAFYEILRLLYVFALKFHSR